MLSGNLRFINMAQSSDAVALQNNNTVIEGNKEEIRYCWVCFSAEDDDEHALWVHPCTCRGSTKWVHQLCLQRWVDEKQRGNILERVSCPQCNTDYIIVFPEINSLIYFLDVIDKAVKRVYPFVAAGILMVAIYWISITYGALTTIQILGNNNLTSVEKMDQFSTFINLPVIPFVMRIIGKRDCLLVIEQVNLSISLHSLLISLPAIPLILILGKLICWEDSVLNILRKYSTKVPFFKYILPSFADKDGEAIEWHFNSAPITDTASAYVFCSALLLPTIAKICGNLFFESVSSHFYRTLLGGLTFVFLKGCFKIYYKQQLYVRQKRKVILDYTPKNIDKNSQLSNHNNR